MPLLLRQVKYIFLLVTNYARYVFTMGNYPRQPAAASLFLNSPDLSFLMEVESVVIKYVSFTKVPQSFATIKLLIKGTFFAFSPFIYLLVRREGCSVFFLELLVD